MYSLGYNSFWSFGSPAVQELLTKSDLQLDELLEEDGLILEVKNHNQNLYDFILKEDNFKQLINCAISIPDVEKLEHNQKKCYKFPFTCADILSSDSQPIVSEFFKSRKELQEAATKTESHHSDDDEVNIDNEGIDKDTTNDETQTTEDEKQNSPENNEFPFLDYLFAFLDSETLNLTSAGYFAKIVNNLLNKRPSELISYIYERKPEVLNKMIKHIGSKSVAEFLAKVLTFESSVLSNVNNEVYNERRSEVLKEIIKKLEPETDMEETNNTAYLICEVFGKYNTMHCSHDILQILLDKSIIEYFFKIIKSGQSTSACAVALILGNIFAYYILVSTPKHDTSDNLYGDNPNTFHPPTELSEDIPLVAVFIENLEDIVKFIGSSSGDGIPGQHGSKAVPFGSARLKVLELIIIAMKAYNQKISSKLVECNFFETLLDIFVKHEWNNMLHNQVEKILTHIIEGNSDELRTALFEKAKLLDFIVKASKDSESTLSGKHSRKVRKGYLGQIVKLSNKIIEIKNPIIEKAIEESESWKEYVDTTLTEANQRDKVNFGGRDPRAPMNTEEDTRLELPGFLQKFTRLMNSVQGKNAQKDDNDNDNDDDNNEEEKKEEEEEIEEDVEEPEEEEDKHQEYQSGLVTSDEFISETEKNVLEVSSPRAHEEEMVKQATVPVRGRHSFDPLNKVIPDYEEREKEEIEKNYVLDAAALKTVEEKLDPHYFGNVYWKRDEIFSADDVLKEFEGL